MTCCVGLPSPKEPILCKQSKLIDQSQGGRHMSILFLIIIGTAAGFIATRIMDVEMGVPQTIAVGVIGALVGGWIIQFLLSMMGAAAGLVGAIFGAVLLLWLYQKYVAR